jgi:hypothetical protein
MTMGAGEMVPVICVTWGEFCRHLPTSPGSGGLPHREKILSAFDYLLSPVERAAANVRGLRIRPQRDVPTGSRLAYEPRGDTNDGGRCPAIPPPADW